MHGDTFGGSVGGPVVLPHLYNGHNKSFFFGAYEGWRHPAQDDPLREGSQHTDEAGRLLEVQRYGRLHRPQQSLHRRQLRHNHPPGSISQIALNTLKQFYPDPNIGDPTAYTDNGVANWQANVDASGHSDQFDVRGDQYFGSNQKFLLWGQIHLEELSHQQALRSFSFPPD